MDTEQMEGEPLDLGDFAAPMPERKRGFLDPAVLARAQETRRQNKEERAGMEADLVGSEDGVEPRKRGRPKGVPNRKSRDLRAVEAMLVSIHAMIAASTQMPEIAIDASESHIVAEAVANVADQYKIKLDGKTGAIAVLIYSLGIVYGPRAVAIAIRMRNERNGRYERRERNENPVA